MPAKFFTLMRQGNDVDPIEAEIRYFINGKISSIHFIHSSNPRGFVICGLDGIANDFAPTLSLAKQEVERYLRSKYGLIEETFPDERWYELYHNREKQFIELLDYFETNLTDEAAEEDLHAAVDQILGRVQKFRKFLELSSDE